MLLPMIAMTTQPAAAAAAAAASHFVKAGNLPFQTADFTVSLLFVGRRSRVAKQSADETTRQGRS